MYILSAELPSKISYHKDTVYYMNVICVTGDKASAKRFNTYEEAQAEIQSFRNLLPKDDYCQIDIEELYEEMSLPELEKSLEYWEDKRDMNDLADDFAYTNGSHARYQRMVTYIEGLIKQKKGA